MSYVSHNKIKQMYNNNNDKQNTYKMDYGS